jgi:hypothetical protein
VRKDLLPLAEAGLRQRGYPPRDAAAIATFMIAAFRGLLIDLVANQDRGRLSDAMEIFIFVTQVMAEKGPPAAAAPPAMAGREDRVARRGRRDQSTGHCPGRRGSGGAHLCP